MTEHTPATALLLDPPGPQLTIGDALDTLVSAATAVAALAWRWDDARAARAAGMGVLAIHAAAAFEAAFTDFIDSEAARRARRRAAA